MSEYTAIVGLIAETRTQTGLQVKCALSTKSYPTKNKVSDDPMADLDLLKHPILPQWNDSTRFAKICIDAKNSTYQFSRTRRVRRYSYFQATQFKADLGCCSSTYELRRSCS